MGARPSSYQQAKHSIFPKDITMLLEHCCISASHEIDIGDNTPAFSYPIIGISLSLYFII